ncbi:hypothetical protein SB766_06740 [Pseudomonas sp. SIMBA_077]
MTMSQDVSFRCLCCKHYFELSTDQVDVFMACGTVACPQCSQKLGLKESDLEKLVALKNKNERRIWLLVFIMVVLPLLGMLSVVKWGGLMGVVGAFIWVCVFTAVRPFITDVAFIRFDVKPIKQAAQGW